MIRAGDKFLVPVRPAITLMRVSEIYSPLLLQAAALLGETRLFSNYLYVIGVRCREIHHILVAEATKQYESLCIDADDIKSQRRLPQKLSLVSFSLNATI